MQSTIRQICLGIFAVLLAACSTDQLQRTTDISEGDLNVRENIQYVLGTGDEVRVVVFGE